MDDPLDRILWQMWLLIAIIIFVLGIFVFQIHRLDNRLDDLEQSPKLVTEVTR